MNLIELSGHVYRIRDHGGVLFLDLLQFNSIKPIKLMTKNNSFIKLLLRLNKGSWLKILGRPEKNTQNYIIDVLNEVKYNFSELDPSRVNKWSKQNRLRYRWMYLRSTEARQILILRNQLISSFRDLLNPNFLEVSTPIITSPVEEGSRGFLVPSRIHREKSYALAQSPQIYKQFLIYAGINYFQIAPVFRDEDGREDRVNGEFYQLDLEGKFNSLDSLIQFSIDLIEKVLQNLKVGYRLYENISYHDSLEKYKTDKPPKGEKILRIYEGSFNKLLNIVVVRDFPMFKLKKDGRLSYMNNPFSKVNWNSEIKGKGELSILAYQFDIVVSGIEIMSGGLRSIESKDLKRVFTILKGKKLDNKYNSLLKAFKSGVPQHGGFGLGIERLLSLIGKIQFNRDINVNDTLAFPLDSEKKEILTGAPRKVRNKENLP